MPLKFFLKKFYGTEAKKAKNNIEPNNPIYYVEKLNEIRQSYVASIDQFQG